MNTKYFKGLLLVLSCMCVLSSCIQEEWGVGNLPRPEGAGRGEWNKNKTIEVYFITELADVSVSAADAVVSFFKKKGNACSIGVVDRLDGDYSLSSSSWGGRLSPTKVAFETAHFSCFALNRFNGTKIEGSSILFNHKINSEESFRVTDDCYIKFINIQAKAMTENSINIMVPFSTVRFEQKEQIDAAVAGALKTLSGNAYGALIVGTVKTDLLSDLQTAVSKVEGYALEEATKGQETEYTLFVLGPKSWVLREMTKESVSGNLNVYCLRIEASVEA